MSSGCVPAVIALRQHESAWARKAVCTLATLDVKGAYDSIQSHLLTARLHEQGWPLAYVKWGASFTAHRQARIRLDDYLGPARDIPQGLPQGSPVSPILFLLFMQPLFKLMPSSYGCVDDMGILASAATLAESSAMVAKRVEKTDAWIHENRLKLERAKAEFQHLHRTRKDSVSITIHGQNRSPNTVTRWLGMFLDTKLSFNAHVSHWCSKVFGAVAQVRRLGNTIKGASPQLTRYAAMASTLPVLLYGADVWWGLFALSRAKRWATAPF